MDLKQGTIAIAAIRPPSGPIKRRPVVIATPTELIPGRQKVLVIGISGSFRPGDPDIIPVPYRDDGNVCTGFKRPCAISFALRDEIEKGELEITRCWIGKTALLELVKRLKKL